MRAWVLGSGLDDPLVWDDSLMLDDMVVETGVEVEEVNEYWDRR